MQLPMKLAGAAVAAVMTSGTGAAIASFDLPEFDSINITDHVVDTDLVKLEGSKMTLQQPDSVPGGETPEGADVTWTSHADGTITARVEGNLISSSTNTDCRRVKVTYLNALGNRVGNNLYSASICSGSSIVTPIDLTPEGQTGVAEVKVATQYLVDVSPTEQEWVTEEFKTRTYGDG